MSPSPFAVWWKDPTGADGILNILIDSVAEEVQGGAGGGTLLAAQPGVEAPSAGSTSAEGPLKKQKQAPLCREAALAAAAAAAAASGGTQRCLVVHSLVLAASSDYFKARFYPAAATADMICDDGGGGPIKVITERVASSEHAEALETVLRFCYTHTLCVAEEAAAQPTSAELLMIVELSDKYINNDCRDAALSAMVARGFTDSDTGIAVTIFRDGLPPSAQLSMHAATLQGVARVHVQQCIASMGAAAGPLSEEQVTLLRAVRLDDAEAVCSAVCAPGEGASCRLDLLLPHLPFHALLHLLQGTLIARSENSVLMMVDAWVAAHPAASVAQHQKLAAALRLGRLGRAFLFEMLGYITWLHLTRTQDNAISRFATSSAKQQTELLASRFLTSLLGPAAWYAQARTTLPQAGPSVDFTWDVTEAQLRAALAARSPGPSGVGAPLPLRSPKYFCNSATMHFELQIHADPLKCRITAAPSIGVYPAFLIGSKVGLSINGLETIGFCKSMPYGALSYKRLARLVRDGLSIENWAPYLVGGVMRMSGNIHIFDEGSAAAL